jgi:hypothetical protein
MSEEERDIYDFSVPVSESYAWDRSGLSSARMAGVLDIGSRILSVLLVLAALWFLLAHSDAFSGLGALLALLCAAVILGWGIMLSAASALRRHLWKLAPASRHDYALRLYHGASGKNPKKAAELLLGMARADVEEGRIGQAAAALSHVDAALLQGDELKLCYLLSFAAAAPGGGKTADDALVRYLAVPAQKFEGFPDEGEARSWLEDGGTEAASAAVKCIRNSKHMHPLAILAISLMLSHSLAFIGMLYGLNTEAGWKLRCGYASAAGFLASLSIVVLGILLARAAAKAPLYGRNGKPSKVLRASLGTCAVIIALCLALQLAIDGPFMHDGKERMLAEDVPDSYTGQDYDFIAVDWPGYDPDETTTDYWRTRDPFFMEKWSEASYYESERQQVTMPDADTSRDDADDADTSSASEDASGATADIGMAGTGYAGMEQRMQVLASYLAENAIVPKTGVFEMDADAKGNPYASLGTGADIEGDKSVTVEYRILSNGETSDEQGNLVESFVVEKWYPEDAGREVEIVGFYLVDERTNAVTDEETTSW